MLPNPFVRDDAAFVRERGSFVSQRGADAGIQWIGMTMNRWTNLFGAQWRSTEDAF